MNNKWWLIDGVIVEITKKINGITDIFYEEYSNQALYFNCIKIVPIGVPFDCMPKWAEKIYFSDDGLCFRVAVGGVNIPFTKCPKEWKGKTFEITDELRELIK